MVLGLGKKTPRRKELDERFEQSVDRLEEVSAALSTATDQLIEKLKEYEDD
jgi:exonuclease VII small subunit